MQYTMQEVKYTLGLMCSPAFAAAYLDEIKEKYGLTDESETIPAEVAYYVFGIIESGIVNSRLR